MGERPDIIKTTHRAMQHAGGERSPELYAVHATGVITLARPFGKRFIDKINEVAV